MGYEVSDEIVGQDNRNKATKHVNYNCILMQLDDAFVLPKIHVSWYHESV